MTLSLQKFEDKTLSDGTQFTFDFGDTVQDYIVGLAYFKLSYGEDHNYELSKMAMTLSNVPTGSAGTSIKTTVSADLQDDDHSIDLSESVVSLSAIGVVGSGQDYNVRVGTEYNVASSSAKTKICDNASEPVQSAGVMMAGFSMAYSDAHHRFWKAKTTLSPQDVPNDGLYASITGDFEDDDNHVSDKNSFDLIGITTATTQSPPLMIQTWSGQEPSKSIDVDFADDLQEGYVIDAVRVFIADFYVVYKDRGGLSSTDHEVTAIGAGCTKWSGSGSTKATLTNPHSFVYQTGYGDDAQDNDDSYVNLVIVATQRPA